MEHITNPAQDSQRAYVRVIDYIKQEIRLGHLAIGSRLPPERTLAETLNVSRNSVREALHILEVMGITVSTQGAGHFIAGNFETSLAETMSIMFLLNRLTVEQVSQLRYALEAHRRLGKKFAAAALWAFGEPWANVNECCSVDAYDQPKPAYYGEKAAFRSLHIAPKYNSSVYSKEIPLEFIICIHM